MTFCTFAVPGGVLGLALALTTAAPAQAAGFSLQFFGTGVGDVDRVKIRVDDPNDTLPGPPADVGDTDFTIEFWLRGLLADNQAGAVSCGANVDWILGNIVLDRDRYNQDRKFGISLAAGRVVFGVSGAGTGDRTVCGTTNVLDDQWHHVAVQRRRSDGWLWLFVDGQLQGSADGPDGDLSYPDDGVPGPFCGGPCLQSDPFLVLGAEKHDAGPAYPSFRGRLDELRLSTVLRYAAPFAPPTAPFVPDAATAALYHFDAGTGVLAHDSAGAAGGPSHGQLRPGGPQNGPHWHPDTPFAGPCAHLWTADAGTVGGLVQFSLASPCQPGRLYVAACSFAPSPPIVLGPTVIHLVPDVLFEVSLTAAWLFQDFFGLLDAQGRATCRVLVDPALAGTTFYTTFVTFDPTAATGFGAVALPVGVAVP